MLKVKIGNLEPQEVLKVEFQLIGTLSSELPDVWTLRIPSHISPRYQTQLDLLSKQLDQLMKKDEDIWTSFLVPKVEWSFNIELESSDGIKGWSCPSHNLKVVEKTSQSIKLTLDEVHIPEKDLCFNF